MNNVEDTFRTNIIQYIGVSKCVVYSFLSPVSRTHLALSWLDRAALPHMKRGDVIINTTSVTAYVRPRSRRSLRKSR